MSNLQRATHSHMTSLPLVLDDDEPIGIILRAGRKMLRPAKIWAYCWFTDEAEGGAGDQDRKSTRLNSSHGYISYAVFCLKKKKKNKSIDETETDIHCAAGI